MCKRRLPIPTNQTANQVPDWTRAINLDLVFTNEENMLNNISYLPSLGKSDHLSLSFKFICYTQQQETAFKKLNDIKGNNIEIAKKI